MVRRLLNVVQHRLQLVFLAGIQSQIPSAVDTCGQDKKMKFERREQTDPDLLVLGVQCRVLHFSGEVACDGNENTHTCKYNVSQLTAMVIPV